ncbi:MAG: glycosyltransferase family 2 protein [Calditrichaeota bacterium]|nr:glycosyltransferase family 2 protein [Calditrichota bacterium]
MKISVIIITYNRVNDLVALLENLKSQTVQNFETIVVDNNSSDKTAEIIPRDFPQVRFIKNDRNAGVPGGRNIGIREAKGEFLVFVDNDAELAEDALEKVVKTFETYPKAGILTFKILNFFTGGIDETSWIIDPELKTVTTPHKVQTFEGAGFAFRREVVDKIGLMWDSLFFMHEEKEYSLRALDAGFDILYTPEIKAYHKISPEERYLPDERFFYYGIRNEFWIYLRNVPWRFTIPHLLFVFFSAALYSARLGYFKFYRKGVFEGIFKNKEALKLRNPIKTATYRQYLALLNKKKDSVPVRLLRFIRAKG